MRPQDRILDAALRVFRRHGFRRSSIEQAADAAEKTGGSLADILAVQVNARLRHLIASFDGSPHIEELFSEHLALGRDLYQKYATAYAAQIASTIERLCRTQRLVLARDMTARTLAQCIEMAMHGAKSAYPSMLPADAFLKDLNMMLRTLVAGAVAPPEPRPAKPARAKKS